MLSKAYLVRASSAIVVLVACGCLVISDTRAEAAKSTNSSKAEKSASNGQAQKSASNSKAQKTASSSETPKENVLVRVWQILFRSSESLFLPENQADTRPAEAKSKKKADDDSPDRGENISSNQDGKGDLFRSDPQYETSYYAQGQVDVYGAKTAVEPPRPLLELGRQQYTSGAYEESSTLLGKKKPLLPGLAIYGDWRTALAYNRNNGKDIAQVDTRLNLDVDFKITGTERIHAFFTPLQKNAKFTRYEFGGDDADNKFNFELDPE